VWALGTNHVSVNCFFFFFKKKKQVRGEQIGERRKTIWVFFSICLREWFLGPALPSLKLAKETMIGISHRHSYGVGIWWWSNGGLFNPSAIYQNNPFNLISLLSFFLWTEISSLVLSKKLMQPGTLHGATNLTQMFWVEEHLE